MIKKPVLWIFLVTNLIFLSGCESLLTQRRSQKAFDTYFDRPKTIAVIAPEIKIYQVDAKGAQTFLTEDSKKAKKNVLEAIKIKFSKLSNIRLNVVDGESLPMEQKTSLHEQQNLHNMLIIQNRMMTPYGHKGTLNRFEFSLGQEISQKLSFISADAILFCDGTNYIIGKKGVRTHVESPIIIQFIGGGLAGIAMHRLIEAEVSPGEPEWDHFSLSLVDMKSGNVLWFNYLLKQGDLRNARFDQKLLKRILDTFPEK